MASGGEGKVLKGFHYYVYYYLVTQWVSFVALFWFLVGDERTMTEAIYKYIADELFHIRFRAHPKTQSLYRPKNGGHTVYLCNHRSFADFFIDGYLTCDAAYIGRMMAIVACPFAGIVGWYRDKAYFFNRGQGCNKGKLYEAMKQLLDRGNNILLYPTGTRNQTLQRQELRWGMIRWAYRESIPVQFVICSNKDRVISEKKFEVRHNQHCVVYNSKVILPEKYSTIEEFCVAVNTLWTEAWGLAYDPSIEPEALDVYVPGADKRAAQYVHENDVTSSDVEDDSRRRPTRRKKGKGNK